MGPWKLARLADAVIAGVGWALLTWALAGTAWVMGAEDPVAVGLVAAAACWGGWGAGWRCGAAERIGDWDSCPCGCSMRMDDPAYPEAHGDRAA